MRGEKWFLMFCSGKVSLNNPNYFLWPVPEDSETTKCGFSFISPIRGYFYILLSFEVQRGKSLDDEDKHSGFHIYLSILSWLFIEVFKVLSIWEVKNDFSCSASGKSVFEQSQLLLTASLWGLWNNQMRFILYVTHQGILLYTVVFWSSERKIFGWRR